MKRLVFPFLVAVGVHLYIFTFDLQVQKPVVSISNQDITVSLNSRVSKSTIFPEQEESKVVRPEPEIATVKEEKKVEQQVILPFKKEYYLREPAEIKGIITPVNVDELLFEREENTKEDVEDTEPVQESVIQEIKKVEQVIDSIIGEHLVNKSKKVFQVSRVIEAVPYYKKNPPPQYPRRAHRRGYEGVVILHVFVDQDGSPKDIKILTSSGYGLLDRAAERAVWQWIFEPARRGEDKLSMWVHVPVRFQLTDIKRK